MSHKKNLLFLFLFFLGCLANLVWTFSIARNAPRQVVSAGSEPVDIRAEERAIMAQLRSLPWQGLRFLSKEREWRFYGVAGERREIHLFHSFEVVKVYYLQEDGALSFTWAALSVKIPGVGTHAFSETTIHSGEMIEVALRGEYVTRNGVYWDDCTSEYCHAAQMVDTVVILDELGTGITNAFIRYGWEPPTAPIYGFLCWQLRTWQPEMAWTAEISEAE
ncbi:MAG: hypothetical protein CVU39_07515 [Chloroflexi bacterium HGW-Chloroflexi-10]|nr:MAG: hypothetical protein CVU39_07515 [Chloroflexi bacterium HGW-Chloroflexi-10]